MGTYIDKLKEFEKKLNVKKEGITITVSGGSGSGKSTVSKAIADEFGLVHMSVGDIFRKLAEVKKMKLEDYTATREPKVDYEADEEAITLAKKGNIVLNGRLTGWVAGDNADIRILVRSNLDVIAERVAARDNKSIEQAKEDVKRRDDRDIEIYKDLYDIDTRKTDIYNIIIDNTDITVEGLRKKAIEEVKKILNK